MQIEWRNAKSISFSIVANACHRACYFASCWPMRSLTRTEELGGACRNSQNCVPLSSEEAALQSFGVFFRGQAKSKLRLAVLIQAIRMQLLFNSGRFTRNASPAFPSARSRFDRTCDVIRMTTPGRRHFLHPAPAQNIPNWGDTGTGKVEASLPPC